MNGVLALVPVNVRPQAIGGNGAQFGKEAVDDGHRIGLAVRRNRDLDAIAGRQDQRFGNALTAFEVLQRGGQRRFRESQGLTHLYGRGLMADACDEQLHWLSSSAPSLSCAAHVTAEQTTTTMAMTAAFLPRHPAVTRRKTMIR